MPPRHGKSMLTSQYFPAWFLGTYPDRRVMLASYEAEFAASWGRKARDVIESVGVNLFSLKLRRDSSAAAHWDLADRTGGMDTAGVGGPLTGKGAHLLLIDDPVKNAEEALSITHRQKAWDWFAAAALTRLEPGGSIVLIQTRWHEDDLAGRVLAQQDGEKWEVLNLPALAEANDPLGRAEGQALWPERYDEPALANIQATMGDRWFAALYQQRPVPLEGGLFKPDWFVPVDYIPELVAKVRYWDLAASTSTTADFTCGALMGRDKAGVYYLLDLQRVRARPADVESLIRRVAEADGRSVRIFLEQEPGSAGLNVISHYTRNVLAGYPFQGDRVTGSKQLRAEPLAAMAQVGNVRMRRGPWNADFLREVAMFPAGAHDDAVDAVSGAFTKVAVSGFGLPDPALFVTPKPADEWNDDDELGGRPAGTNPRSLRYYGRGDRGPMTHGQYKW
jgi:predicted phage terminase large subunit-like protein